MQSSKQVAKNTFFLYIRMFVLMCVNIYTSRIVLNALGVIDYGIYNVVGSLVTMFIIFSGAITSSISRFLAYELGKNDLNGLLKCFTTSLLMMAILGAIVVLIVETAGVWFLNNQMTIPEDRLFAANVVLHYSIASFVFNLFVIPYNAAIIAHEKMAAFAYIGLAEVLLKLFVAFLVLYSLFDKLVSYSFLIFISTIIILSTYFIYCKHNFEECRKISGIDTKFIREMFSYSGWSIIGASSSVARDQGGSLLLNVFCGPQVNAARAIATQACNAISGFSKNFLVAINPPIIKAYAGHEMVLMNKLIYRGANLSFFLMLVIMIPCIFSMDTILQLWLGLVPDYSTSFVRLAFVLALSESLGTTFSYGVAAIGKVKWYEVTVSAVLLLNFPFSYLFLQCGFTPESVYVVGIFVSQICVFTRFLNYAYLTKTNIIVFFKEIYFPCIKVCLIAIFFSIPIKMIFPPSPFMQILLFFITLIICLSSVYFVGLLPNERNIIKSKLVVLKRKTDYKK